MVCMACEVCESKILVILSNNIRLQSPKCKQAEFDIRRFQLDNIELQYFPKQSQFYKFDVKPGTGRAGTAKIRDGTRDKTGQSRKGCSKTV